MANPNSHSTAYDVGYAIGYFVGGYWPYLLVGLAVFVFLVYKIRKRKTE